MRLLLGAAKLITVKVKLKEKCGGRGGLLHSFIWHIKEQQRNTAARDHES